MKQNRTVRTACGIREDIGTVWDSNIKGKYDNNEDGRAIFKGALVEYFTDLARRGAIQNFSADNITVKAGSYQCSGGRSRCSAYWQYGDRLHYSESDIRRETK